MYVVRKELHLRRLRIEFPLLDEFTRSDIPDRDFAFRSDGNQCPIRGKSDALNSRLHGWDNKSICACGRLNDFGAVVAGTPVMKDEGRKFTVLVELHAL